MRLTLPFLVLLVACGDTATEKPGDETTVPPFSPIRAG